MESDTLFDPEQYDDGGKKRAKAVRRTNDLGVVEPLVEPWVLLVGKKGPVGYHIEKGRSGSLISALCGAEGRQMTPELPMMVRCFECNKKLP